LEKKVACYFNENEKSSNQNAATRDEARDAASNNEAINETSSTYHFEDDFDVSDQNIDAMQNQHDEDEDEDDSPVQVIEQKEDSEIPLSKFESSNQNHDQEIKPVAFQVNPPETKQPSRINSPEIKPAFSANGHSNDNRASIVNRYNPIPRSNQQPEAVKIQPVKLVDEDKTSNIYIMPIENTFEVAAEKKKSNDHQQPAVEEYTVVQQREINLDRMGRDQSLTRVCRLIRTTNNELYGFDLKTFPADGRHIAKNIVKDSPAHRAGLMDGDIILEINGDSIDGLDKNQVITLIKMFPKQVELLVIYYKNIGRLNEVGARQQPPPVPTIKPREIPRYRKNSAFSAVDKRARAASAILNPTGLLADLECLRI
jgi:hypothetical protein